MTPLQERKNGWLICIGVGGLSPKNGNFFGYKIVSTEHFDFFFHQAACRYDAINLILNYDESARLKQEQEAWKTFQQRMSRTHVSNSTQLLVLH
jgi:hypothetical protein